MVKKFGLMVVFVVFVSCASFAQRPHIYIGLGGGLFGGMSAAAGEFGFRTGDNSYLRIGLPVTDSLNLSPEKDWRRFGLLNIDCIFYFSDDSYFGAGLNYPWKISDKEKPGPGGEIFFGREVYISQRGKIYGEIGYGVASRAVGDPFAGLLLFVGWRYDLIPAKENITSDASIKNEISTQELKIDLPVASISTPEPENKNDAGVRRLEQELNVVAQSIEDLDVKIIKARKQKQYSTVRSLKALKAKAIAKANALKGDIAYIKAKASI